MTYTATITDTDTDGGAVDATIRHIGVDVGSVSLVPANGGGLQTVARRLYDAGCPGYMGDRETL